MELPDQLTLSGQLEGAVPVDVLCTDDDLDQPGGLGPWTQRSLLEARVCVWKAYSSNVG